MAAAAAAGTAPFVLANPPRRGSFPTLSRLLPRASACWEGRRSPSAPSTFLFLFPSLSICFRGGGGKGSTRASAQWENREGIAVLQPASSSSDCLTRG